MYSKKTTRPARAYITYSTIKMLHSGALTSEIYLLEKDLILDFSELDLNHLSDHLCFSNLQKKSNISRKKQTELKGVNL